MKGRQGNAYSDRNTRDNFGTFHGIGITGKVGTNKSSFSVDSPKKRKCLSENLQENLINNIIEP